MASDESWELWLRCTCSHDAHTLRFTYFPTPKGDEPPEIFLSVHLSPHHGFFGRLWRGLKYIFNIGEPCPYGCFDETIIGLGEAEKLAALLDRMLKRN